MTDKVKSISVNDSEFASISNEIFEFNQKRFRIKNWFNLLTCSNIKEQKSYSLCDCKIMINDIIIFHSKRIELYFILLEYDAVTIVSNFNNDIMQLINIPTINYIDKNFYDEKSNNHILLDSYSINESIKKIFVDL
jgi:hypothetical protein